MSGTIIGHEAIVKDFKRLVQNIHTNRSDSHGAFGHGYIFFGPPMIGKKEVARSIANALEKNVFESPLEGGVLQDTMLIDVAYMKQIDPDAKDSIGINAIREIKNFLWQRPIASPRRTLIIAEAEFLTTEAQNALLKITEEPPESSLIIIVTSDIESIIPTIRSRLPQIYFGTIPQVKISAWLQKFHGISKAKADALAKQSLGKPGLAMRFLTDKDFESSLELAERFLKTLPAARKDFIKKLIEPDEFNLRNFLETVIMVLAWQKPTKARNLLWHKTLGLYENATNFGLNPRLQLESLLR